MSMNATFVQVDQTEIVKFQADPSLVEALFEDESLALPPAFAALTKVAEERLRTMGPQMLASTLAQFDPAMREQLEKSIGRTTEALAAGKGGDDILKLMQERAARSGRGRSPGKARAVLSLDKAWHGVHYLLCGEVEPGPALLSQAVLGGVALGDDDEGFSGYGPARYFTAGQVAELSQALSGPEVESEAAARFDAGRMSEINIYPRWRPSDAEWVMDAFRRLRDFYADAAGQGRAMVTCLV
jgi:hypothetical protein